MTLHLGVMVEYDFSMTDKLRSLRQAVTDRLERPSQAGHWDIPLRIRVEGASLIYDVNAAAKRVSEDEKQGLLEDFIRLGSADDRAILKYAHQWGVLGLCKHNLPTDHPELWPLVGAAGMRENGSPFLKVIPEGEDRALSDPDLGICRPVENEQGQQVETLAAWRFYARTAKELLERAAALHKASSKGKKTLAAWSEVALTLDDWFFLAPLQIGSALNRNKLSVRLQPVNSLSALSAILAAQTLFAASRSSGLITCFSCGRLYLPSRRIEEGRGNYCRDCGRPAALRDAQARKRAKTRVLELGRRGLSTKKIAEVVSIDPRAVKEVLTLEKPNGKK